MSDTSVWIMLLAAFGATFVGLPGLSLPVAFRSIPPCLNGRDAFPMRWLPG